VRIIQDRPELWPFILLSLVLHALLIAFLPRVAPTVNFAEKPIEIIPVTMLPEGSSHFRIADIEKPAVEQKPAKSQFLGLYDSAVREETVSTGRGTGSPGRRSATRQAARRPMAKAPAGSAGGKIFAFDSGIFEEKKSPEPAAGERGEGGMPGDFYPDFRRGPHTYLNVLRYPEVAYFVRLKRAFKLAFNPEPVLREHFSQNTVARGSIDVVLGVSVDRSGNLAELFVFRSSGLSAYDGEAMRTVRASAPFSTPPEKFLEDDGLLRMSWTFTVYM
jgi:TonB family protein